jgi:hypothetical protein
MPAAAPVTTTTLPRRLVSTGPVYSSRSIVSRLGTPGQATAAAPQERRLSRGWGASGGRGRGRARARPRRRRRRRWSRRRSPPAPAPRSAPRPRRPPPPLAARHDHEAQPFAGDRAPRGPGVCEERGREVRLRADEDVGGPRPRLERRHVGDDQAAPGRPREEVAQVEVAAAGVDGVCRQGGDALRGPRLAAAVEVDDRPLPAGSTRTSDRVESPGTRATADTSIPTSCSLARSHSATASAPTGATSTTSCPAWRRGIATFAPPPPSLSLRAAASRCRPPPSAWRSVTTSSCAIEPKTTMRAKAFASFRGSGRLCRGREGAREPFYRPGASAASRSSRAGTRHPGACPWGGPTCRRRASCTPRSPPPRASRGERIGARPS